MFVLAVYDRHIYASKLSDAHRVPLQKKRKNLRDRSRSNSSR